MTGGDFHAGPPSLIDHPNVLTIVLLAVAAAPALYFEVPALNGTPDCNVKVAHSISKLS